MKGEKAKRPGKRIWVVGSLWGEETEFYVCPSQRAALQFKREDDGAGEVTSGPFLYERVEEPVQKAMRYR